jgi:hypothetical protein
MARFLRIGIVVAALVSLSSGGCGHKSGDLEFSYRTRTMVLVSR